MVTDCHDEHPVVFDCEGDMLVGIVSRARETGPRGVVIVVGGPQYRAGSHRQFVLLARYLAQQGVAAMRFDYRGMGDSTGTSPSFERIDADIRAAIDCFIGTVPQVKEVVLWGLCDAASACMFYAHKDERVQGLVLLNPWVRTVAGEAKAYLRHYYLERLTDPAFWSKALHGKLRVGSSLKGIAMNFKRALARQGMSSSPERKDADNAGTTLPQRMAQGLARFRGKVLLVLSGNDLTAKEFSDTAAASQQWRELLAADRVTRQVMSEANHTFSTRDWRDRVAAQTCEWVRSW